MTSRKKHMTAASRAAAMSRRNFLGRGIQGAGAIASLQAIQSMQALASSPPVPGDFKALVCFFMAGGNDSDNMIVSRDATEHAAYADAKGNLAVPLGDVLPTGATSSDGRPWGFNPNLPELHQLYQQGDLAILGNVGRLLAPTTRADYLAGNATLPHQLFSHNDQIRQWQSATAELAPTSGWGGRLADRMDPLQVNPLIAISTSLSGSNLFLSGKTSPRMDIGGAGPTELAGTDPSFAISAVRDQAINDILALPTPHLFETEIAESVQEARVFNANLKLALGSAPSLTTAFPAGIMGARLKLAAEILSVRGALNMRRQILFVGMGGFDTHLDQSAPHPTLLQKVSQSIAAFYAATQELGIAQDVTLFTASDFGRTLTTNGRGTDHGWGGHHMVVGGAVQGGAMYGRMPTLALNGPDDTKRGRWIPSTSVDEYAATLACWFGLPAADLPDVLPNIGRFAAPDLGFMV